MDRDRFAECSLMELSKTIPPEYQYFNDYGAELAPHIGSSFKETDYCPFPKAIVRVNLLLYNIIMGNIAETINVWCSFNDCAMPIVQT